MNVRDALRGHRMTRAFDGTELVEAQLVGLCEDALRAPTAGHSRGVDAIVLAGTAGVRRYLHVATDPTWRAGSTKAEGLGRAGGAVLVVCEPSAYASRYAAPDKVGSGLDDVAAWPVPYWFGDAAFATMALLLLAEEAGLAGCFLGAFRNEPDVLADVGAPRGRRLFGAVLLGHAASVQSRSSSLDRDGPSRADRVVRGGYPRD
jgi:nitroreductase